MWKSAECLGFSKNNAYFRAVSSIYEYELGLPIERFNAISILTLENAHVILEQAKAYSTQNPIK